MIYDGNNTFHLETVLWEELADEHDACFLRNPLVVGDDGSEEVLTGIDVDCK